MSTYAALTIARLEALLQRHQITHAALADRMNISRQTTWRWFTGKRRPTLDDLDAILRELGETPTTFENRS